MSPLPHVTTVEFVRHRLNAEHDSGLSSMANETAAADGLQRTN